MAMSDWQKHLSRLVSRLGFEVVQTKEFPYSDVNGVDCGLCHQVIAAHREHKLLAVSESFRAWDSRPDEEFVASSYLHWAWRGPMSHEMHSDHLLRYTGGPPASVPVGRFYDRMQGGPDDEWWRLEHYRKYGFVNWDVRGSGRHRFVPTVTPGAQLSGRSIQNAGHCSDVLDIMYIDWLDFLAFAPDWVRSFILDPPDPD